ncbi:rhodanese-like domain-containing protein [uncultured Sneathiella sp.]|uniref:rhodanese-like domain-containing protein n=1 Tax=uncultured Sneathiella sp. TaxID=879315 RepID=UPI00259A07E0|nr:rhodanese-like domain-containing protein [uncultured Sneathiella sp.]
MTNAVLSVPAADSSEVLTHFETLMRFETDCWDVHESLASGGEGFVVLDVRSPSHYRAGHVPGAINMPQGRITARNLDHFPSTTVFVVYCAGPHCNGADKAAMRIARIGRPVKKMIGGVTGWVDEGFQLSREDNSNNDATGLAAANLEKEDEV